MDVLPRIAYVDGPRLRDDAANLPTTSQPSRADFLRTFEQAGEDGERIVGVLLGSTLSGTFASAEAVGCPPIVQPVTEALRRRYGPGVEILSAPATRHLHPPGGGRLGCRLPGGG